MKSVAEVLNLSAHFLESKKIDRSRRLAEDLLAHILKCKRIDLYLQYERPLVNDELALMREWVKRCAFQEPIEYLIGEVEFLGCRISVDKRVLIPRPETEILVDLAIKKINSLPDLKEKILWDLCTGSGCMGIALKKRFPALRVCLSDSSQEALELALENSRKNEVEVEIFQGDFLEPFRGRKADFILCNPPYVSAAEYTSLDSSVKDFEPKVALVGGERGTEFYERLAKEVPPLLNNKALVFLEIGAGQKEAIQKIFSSPVWSSCEPLKDWSGKDRFFFLEKDQFV